jgi:myosin III
LETTRIRKEGYSLRPTVEEFVERFKYLSSDNNNLNNDRETCVKILQNTMLQNWRVGKTKVFLKYYHGDMLQSLLSNYIQKAVIIQKHVRRFLAQISYRQLLVQVQKTRELVIIFFETIVHVSQSCYSLLAKTSKIIGLID